MNTILGLGFVALTGVASARLISKIGFPSVTAYLLLGVLIGPSVLKLLPGGLLTASNLIANIVLGVVAFGIGQNFQLARFKEIGKSVLWVSVLEACGAWVFVTLAFLFLLGQPLYVALLFGAIASATAPAATIMVIREYRAKGVFTNTLLGVVAIDDAWCLIIFAVSLAVSKALYVNVTDTVVLLKTILLSMLEIGGAFVLGTASAYVLSYFSKYIHSATDLFICTFGYILLCVGLALAFHLSVLLSCMFLGAVLMNIHPLPNKFFDSLQHIEPLLFLLFFVLAGANLEIGLLKNLGLAGLVYLAFRVAGKVLGAYWGAQISNASEPIKKYLGLGLVPQAGVALGCALIVKADFPEVGRLIFSTIVATTVVYELIGPICTKTALSKAGEISTSKIEGRHSH